jgi:branched-subunit amino acid aminotransferase/4-amino-4-deoxychorismate lyase
VIEWGRAAGITITERSDLTVDNLLDCDGAFLTSSTRDVQPISKIGIVGRDNTVTQSRELEVPTVIAKLAEIFAQQSAINYNP